MSHGRARLQGLLTLLVAVIAPPATAQHDAVVRYGEAEGLLTTTAFSVTEDRRGFIWVGSEFDLYRFDGVDARRFTPHPTRPGAYRGFVVRALAPDPDGNGVLLWTRGGGLQRASASGDRIDPVPTPALLDPREAMVYVMLTAPDGRLWFGTGRGAVVRERGGAVRAIPVTDALPEVVDLAFGPDGRVWLVTPGALHVVRPDGGAAVRVLAATDATGPLTAVAVLPGGSVWAGGANGVFEANAGRWLRRATTAPVTDLAALPDGRVWVGTQRGVVRLDTAGPQKASGSSTGTGFPEERVRQFHVDRRGRLWALVGGRLVAYTPGPRHVRWEFAETTRDLSVLNARHDADATVWLSTLGRGLLRCRAARCVRMGGALQSHGVEDTREGSGGTRYVAAYTDGLWCLAPRAASMRPCFGPPNPRTLALGPDGRLWSTTADSGVYVHRPSDPPGRWHAAPADVQGTRDRIAALTKPVLASGNGEAWVGTLGGGLYYARDTPAGPVVRRVALDPEREEALRVVSLARRGDTLYAATLERGVARVVGAPGARPTVRWIDTQAGLPSDQAKGLVHDRRGRLWVITDVGPALLLPDGTAQGFTGADGWPVVQATWDGASLAPDGRLWVGTMAGVLSFDPDAFAATTPPPPVYLTHVRVRGALRWAEAGAMPLRLRHDENVVSVHLSTDDAGPVRPWTYVYRLVREGENASWQSLGRRAELDIAGVAPGRYRLDVRTELAGRVSPATSMALTVAPPWWQTLWFRGLLGLSVAALLGAAYRARVAHLIALDRTRRRIADDLHDDLGSKLASLATRLDVAELIAAQRPDHASSGNADAELPGERPAAAARALVGDLSDAVWLIDAHADRLDHLADKIERVARSVIPSGALRVRAGSLPPLPLPPHARRHVLLAVREMLHNAARHGTAPYTLSMEADDARPAPTLRITLAHPRRALDAPPVPTGGRGLETLQRRAAALGGAFTLTIEGDEARAQLAFPVRRPSPLRRAWEQARGQRSASS